MSILEGYPSNSYSGSWIENCFLKKRWNLEVLMRKFQALMAIGQSQHELKRVSVESNYKCYAHNKQPLFPRILTEALCNSISIVWAKPEKSHALNTWSKKLMYSKGRENLYGKMSKYNHWIESCHMLVIRGHIGYAGWDFFMCSRYKVLFIRLYDFAVAHHIPFHSFKLITHH